MQHRKTSVSLIRPATGEVKEVGRFYILESPDGSTSWYWTVFIHTHCRRCLNALSSSEEEMDE